MPSGYHVLAFERRVLSVMFDDDAIHRAIGCQTVAHGTTLHTEDQLLISGDEFADMPAHHFYARGVPFPFAGNALFADAEPIDGSIADRSLLSIDEFRSMISFATQVEVSRLVAATDADGV